MTLPQAFFVLGPAGSGKSTVAGALAQAKRAAYVDKDAVAGSLVELLLAEHGDDPHARESNDFYRQRIMPSEYRALFDVAASNLHLGLSVVLDAPFATFIDQPRFLLDSTAAAGWPPTEIVIVEVRTTPEVMRRRILARGLTRDRWKLENWDEFWARFGVPTCEWLGARRVTVDNDGDPDLTQLIGQLGDHGAV